MKQEKAINWHSKNVKRSIVILLIALFIFYGALPNLHDLGINLHLHFPRLINYVFLAQVCFLLTFLFSALNYKFIAFKKLKLAKTVLVQFSSFMLELILPVGLGNISVNYLFLRTNQHNRLQSGLIVAICNLLGAIGNISILAILLLIFGVSKREKILYYKLPSFGVIAIILLVILLVAVIAYFVAKKHKVNFVKLVHQLMHYIASYEKRPSALLAGYLAAALQAIFTGLCFWLIIKSFNLDVSYISAFIIYGLSVLVGVVTPTPGGLGGIEASLVAGLLAIHATNPGTAVSLVLVYRLVSYWIPVGLGLISLFLVQRLRIIKWHYK